MSLRSENLQHVSNTLYQFSSARAAQYSFPKELIAELSEINASLASKKLTIQIFSRFPSLAQGLNNLLSTYQSLPQFYQFQISSIPSLSPSFSSDYSPPTIVLQANHATKQQEIRYQLSLPQKYLIGRDLQQQNTSTAIYISLPNYKKVSSFHAEIQSVANCGDRWQICDRNSTNGTFINGQRVQGCQALKSGDRITLAYPSASEKAPEFIFHAAIQQDCTSELLNGDLICLVVAPQQLLTEEEKYLIQQASQAQITGLIIIADTSGANAKTIQKMNIDLQALEQWISIQYPILAEKVEISHLELYPFYSSTINAALSSDNQQQYANFCENLAIIGSHQSEQILIRQSTLKLQERLRQIADIVQLQEEKINQESQRIQDRLKGQTLNDWRERTIRITRSVGEEKDDFFRRVRVDIGRAKMDFSAHYVANSLIQRIEEFANQLYPTVTRQNGQVCIQLQPEGKTNTHEVMLQFCQTEILNWAGAEWSKICHSHSNGGLNRLLQNSYDRLNCVPMLTLSNQFHPPVSQVDLKNSLQGTFVTMQNEVSYDRGAPNHLNNAVGLGMQFAMAAGMYFVSPISAAFQSVRAASSLMGLVGSTLGQQQIQNLKLEQTIASLKRSTALYYQNVAKHLLERVVQDLWTSLDEEERRFRKALEATDEQFVFYFSNLKTSLDNHALKQQTLNQDKAFLEQIYRSLS